MGHTVTRADILPALSPLREVLLCKVVVGVDASLGPRVEEEPSSCGILTNMFESEEEVSPQGKLVLDIICETGVQH